MDLNQLRAAFVLLAHQPSGRTAAEVASTLGVDVITAAGWLQHLMNRGLVRWVKSDSRPVRPVWRVVEAHLAGCRPGEHGQATLAFDHAFGLPPSVGRVA